MPQNNRNPKPAPVTALLDAVKSQPMKSFTQKLRSLEKDFDTYPEFLVEDAERMFRSCRLLFEKSKNKIVRYNAIRLIKYAVTTKEFLREHVEDIWSLAGRSLIDPDGNVRNAGIQLISRYRFGMLFIADCAVLDGIRKERKEFDEETKFQKKMIEQLFELCEMEKAHSDPKILKTIRRAIEEYNRGTMFSELAQKHGYELPERCIQDHFPSEFEDVPYHERGDMEAATLKAGENGPAIISPPPNPKDFRTFEEYEGALKLRDYFIKKVAQVDAIMSSGKSEEEIDAAMAAIGFQTHLDAPCMKKWCEENYGCVSRCLAWRMRFFEECIFEGQLKPENMLLSDQELERCEAELCAALPEEWIDVGSRKQRAFAWFIDLMNWLEWNQDKTSLEELASEPVCAAFLQEVYWWVLHVLRGRQLPEGWKGKAFIEEFLKTTNLIKKDDVKELLGRFKKQE